MGDLLIYPVSMGFVAIMRAVSLTYFLFLYVIVTETIVNSKNTKKHVDEPTNQTSQPGDIKLDKGDDAMADLTHDLTIDRYFASLPEEFIYGFCQLMTDPSLSPNSQVLLGTIDLRQSLRGGPTQIIFNISGFSTADNETSHGAHIDEYGDLSKGCSSTGGHYDPFNVVHGGPSDTPQFRHFGDLGNIEEDKDGHVTGTMSDYLVSLLGPFSVLGRAFVVDETRDDLGRGHNEGSFTSGNSGSRLACCTIGLSDGARWLK